MDVGVLGGTFDPVHLGHLAIAEEARKRLSLKCVIFIPAGQPWLKTGREITPVHHRVAMVKLAINGTSYFQIRLYYPSATSTTLSRDLWPLIIFIRYFFTCKYSDNKPISCAFARPACAGLVKYTLSFPPSFFTRFLLAFGITRISKTISWQNALLLMRFYFFRLRGRG